MADGKVLTNETKQLLTKALDDAIKLPFYLEFADGYAIKIILNIVDKKADKFIPDVIDPMINTGIRLAFEGNKEQAAMELGTALNLLVNVPYLEEDTEQALCVDGFRFLLRVLLDWVKKK